MRYCVLSTGGVASVAGTTSGTQDWNYQSIVSVPASQASFIFGENCEVIARRGVMSGLNATASPIFLECSIMTAPTNSHNVFIHSMQDVIYVHDVHSGDVQARL